jgi:hypothetical protein
MSSFSPLLAFAFLATGWALPGQGPGSANLPVVSIEPACAQWSAGDESMRWMIPPQIMISYNPQAPGARLASARSLALVAAGSRGSRFVVTEVSMSRTLNGPWQAVFTPGGEHMPIPGYWIFYFEDEAKRADNNRAQYWDLLMCGSELSAIAQASTYEGRELAPGFQRARDLPHATDLLKASIEQFPEPYMSYGRLWWLELELAHESPNAYEQVGRELDSLLTAHGNSMYALHQVASFVAWHRQKLPPTVVQRFRDTVAALPQAPEVIMHDGRGNTYRTPRSTLPPERIQAIEKEAARILTELGCRAANPDPAVCTEYGWPK